MAANSNRIKLTVPNDISYLPIVLECVSKMSFRTGFSKEEVSKVEIATEEAVANVINHAFESREDASFDVIIEQQTLGVKVIVKEMGIPFDPSLIPEFDKDNLLISSKGLGTHLMRSVVDEVSFLNLGKEGKETHLFKYLNNKTVEDLMSKKEKEAADKAKRDAPLERGSVKYTARRMKPEEAVDVSKGAYSSYGYTYVLEHIYFPDRVREMNKTDELISYVAVTDDTHEVIAHTALEIEEMDRMVPQVGVAFTKPKFRGQGCINVIGDLLLKDAIRRKFTGIYARGITTHPFSQRALLKMKLMDCAVLLSSGPERTYKGMAKKTQRESIVYHFGYMNKPKPFIIYPPKHHKEIIEKIYDNLEFVPIFGEAEHLLSFNKDGGIQFKQNETTLEILTEADNFVGKIRVMEYGANVLSQVQTDLKLLCMDRMETIYLHLKLTDPYTAFLTSKVEKMGFFFAGIIPGSENNDALVLQYLNNHKLDFSQLQLAGDMSKEILEYIKEL